jgi:hypothetical protein
MYEYNTEGQEGGILPESPFSKVGSRLSYVKTTIVSDDSCGLPYSFVREQEDIPKFHEVEFMEASVISKKSIVSPKKKVGFTTKVEACEQHDFTPEVLYSHYYLQRSCNSFIIQSK